MSRCQLMRGFFLLRKCSDAAVGQCESCGRSMCAHHADPMSSDCTECTGKALLARDAGGRTRTLEGDFHKEAPETAINKGGRTADDPAVTMAMRDRLYTDGGYQPIVVGAIVGAAAYAAYDLRAFDADMRTGRDDLEAGAARDYLVDS